MPAQVRPRQRPRSSKTAAAPATVAVAAAVAATAVYTLLVCTSHTSKDESWSLGMAYCSSSTSQSRGWDPRRRIHGGHSGLRRRERRCLSSLSRPRLRGNRNTSRSQASAPDLRPKKWPSRTALHRCRHRRCASWTPPRGRRARWQSTWPCTTRREHPRTSPGLRVNPRLGGADRLPLRCSTWRWLHSGFHVDRRRRRRTRLPRCSAWRSPAFRPSRRCARSAARRMRRSPSPASWVGSGQIGARCQLAS